MSLLLRYDPLISEVLLIRIYTKCSLYSHIFEVRASQLAQASERVGSLIPASQQG